MSRSDGTSHPKKVVMLHGPETAAVQAANMAEAMWAGFEDGHAAVQPDPQQLEVVPGGPNRRLGRRTVLAAASAFMAAGVAFVAVGIYSDSSREERAQELIARGQDAEDFCNRQAGGRLLRIVVSGQNDDATYYMRGNDLPEAQFGPHGSIVREVNELGLAAVDGFVQFCVGDTESGNGKKVWLTPDAEDMSQLMRSTN